MSKRPSKSSSETITADLQGLFGLSENYRAVRYASELLKMARKHVQEGFDREMLLAPEGKVFAIRTFCGEITIGQYTEPHHGHRESAMLVSPYEDLTDLSPSFVFHAGMLAVSGEDIIGVAPDLERACIVPPSSLFLIKLEDFPGTSLTPNIAYVTNDSEI